MQIAFQVIRYHPVTLFPRLDTRNNPVLFILEGCCATVKAACLGQHHKFSTWIATLSFKTNTRLIIRLLGAAGLDSADVAGAVLCATVIVGSARCQPGTNCIRTTKAVASSCR
jgi:hypothetical protein